MNPRNLRIAWSVAWGVVSVTLCVLWVRSYWRLQILELRTGSQAVQISSVNGHLAIAHLRHATIGSFYLSVPAGDSADFRKKGALGFAYQNDGFVTALIAPHWLPALLAAAFAVVAWCSRSWRFSIRTLFIATTLVAAVLGIVVWMSRA